MTRKFWSIAFVSLTLFHIGIFAPSSGTTDNSINSFDDLSNEALQLEFNDDEDDFLTKDDYPIFPIGNRFAQVDLTEIGDEESMDDDDDDDENNFLSNEEFPMFQMNDGKWHMINMNDTLDPDELYDFSDLSWIEDDDDEFEGFHGRRMKVHSGVQPKLFSKSDPDVPYDLNPINGRDAPVNINHPTKVVIHGWLNSADETWVTQIKDRYFINGNCNVILVDWHRYSLMEYTFSARKTRTVGAYLGQILVSLIQSQKVYAEDIHIVGHLLGAHVAGVAGKTVQMQTGRKIGRITGLDPAGPLFERPWLCSRKKRLHKDDALYVDVIHTDGGLLGFKRSVGHADFFPNHGKGIQPGCGLLINHVCSHLRSYEYYTESVNTHRFLATPCNSWRNFRRGKCPAEKQLSMGLYLDTKKAQGNYFLQTNRRRPYARG